VKVAIIPARGGSKRIPRKNIAEFCGKPMIAWSIGAALESKLFDAVVVSTDDEEIAEVARSYGAEVPFLRPAHLADDFSPTVPVIQHAIEALEKQGHKLKYLCCIYATAPMISSNDLIDAFSILRADSGLDYVFSCAEYPYPIQRALRVDGDNRIAMFDPKHSETRSQDLEPAYHDAGQFYWGTREAFADGRQIFSDRATGHVLGRWKVQDIDTQNDWMMAEKLFQLMHTQS
jgi:pseudaminic acid cytidylyltransferase